MYEALALLAAFTVVYSLVAGGIERNWISGPIIFTAFGLLVGPLGFNFLAEQTDSELLKSLAELTLAIVLFTDASTANLTVLRKSEKLPLRLLAIGLPMTILLGFGVGMLLFGSMSFIELALLATILAPTDAALGKPVVANQTVPNSIRQGLNVESGLNDGICVPIVLFLLALDRGEASDTAPWQIALRLFCEEVGIGLATGVALTGAVVWMLEPCRKRGWLSPTWKNITVIALAFTTFATAQLLGGSGFIACFAGGLFFGGLLKSRSEELLSAADGIGDTFALLTWIYFGAAVIGQAAPYFDWRIVLYAVLSLTAIRMLPVFVSVAGLGIDTQGKLFLGWFGPRGLASIVFVVLVINENVPSSRQITMVCACTVILSIIAHGITANPWANAYGARHAQEGVAIRL